MDSPWSWVVCAVTFFSHVVAIGFSYAISVYYVEFLTGFNESSGTTSWLSSLNFGIKSFIGKRLLMSFFVIFCFNGPSTLLTISLMRNTSNC